MRGENVLRVMVVGFALLAMGSVGVPFAEFANGQMSQIIALAGGYG